MYNTVHDNCEIMMPKDIDDIKDCFRDIKEILLDTEKIFLTISYPNFNFTLPIEYIDEKSISFSDEELIKWIDFNFYNDFEYNFPSIDLSTLENIKAYYSNDTIYNISFCFPGEFIVSFKFKSK